MREEFNGAQPSDSGKCWLHCVIPENIHTPLIGEFLIWAPSQKKNPSGTSSFSFHFPLKKLSLFCGSLTHPLKFPLPFLGIGGLSVYEYFLELHIDRWLLPGILLGPWSPSLGNVIFVPALQPGFTLIVKILSRILDVWPSSFITCWWKFYM